MKKFFLIILSIISGSFIIIFSANAASLSHVNKQSEKSAAEQLGWVSVPHSENICCGYYRDPLTMFDINNLPPLKTTPVTINASQGIFHQTGRSLLLGKVSIAQPGRLIGADRVYINRDAVSKRVTSADLYGNVSLLEPGRYVIGDTAHVDLGTRFAKLTHVIYRYLLGDPGLAGDKDNPPLNAWGRADAAEQKHSGFYEFIHATYTTCAPTTHTWKVTTDKLDLNHATGRGYARNAWLDVQGVPIFYTPYFNFPIDKRRQSGFLFPYFGSSTYSGFSTAFPYYWNIAPNYDATITPQIFARRGLLTSGLFRYLTMNSSGTLNGGFIPNDGYFQRFKHVSASKYPPGFPGLGRLLNSSNNRYSFSWQDSTTFNSHWSGNVNYNSVSDDYYQQDFNSASTLAPNILPRLGTVNYVGDIWNFNGTVQTYEALHPINQATVSNPYDLLPQLNLRGNLPDENYGLQYLFDGQFTYFRRSQNPGETALVPTGPRTNIQPGISWPLIDESGYFTPTLQWEFTHYNVGSQMPGFSKIIARNLPIFDIDSGVYFDRDISFGKTLYQQTLEPRVFFLYVPYRNQNSIPLYDTGVIPFNYDSLFLTNRFSNIDRIGDADQVTFALTSRILDANTDAQKFWASIGQIYYFRDRRVLGCLPGQNPNTCIDNLTAFDITPAFEKRSPLAGIASYNITRALSANATMSWDLYSHQTVYGGGNLQYEPAPNHVFNLGYNFVRLGDQININPPVSNASHENDLNQGTVSFAWPLHQNWSAVGSYGYNLSHRYTQSYFYGLEYNTCCWAVRVVAGRSFSGLNQNSNPTFSNSVYLQFLFKGLATVGNQDPTSTLMSGIPGYQDTFQPFYGLKTS